MLMHISRMIVVWIDELTTEADPLVWHSLVPKDFQRDEWSTTSPRSSNLASSEDACRFRKSSLLSSPFRLFSLCIALRDLKLHFLPNSGLQREKRWCGGCELATHAERPVTGK